MLVQYCFTPCFHVHTISYRYVCEDANSAVRRRDVGSQNCAVCSYVEKKNFHSINASHTISINMSHTHYYFYSTFWPTVFLHCPCLHGIHPKFYLFFFFSFPSFHLSLLHRDFNWVNVEHRRSEKT